MALISTGAYDRVLIAAPQGDSLLLDGMLVHGWLSSQFTLFNTPEWREAERVKGFAKGRREIDGVLAH